MALPPTATIVKSALCRTNAFYRPTPTTFFFPGLTSKPWHEPTFSWCQTLKDNHEEIKSEFLALRETKIASDYQVGQSEHTLHEGKWDWYSYIQKGKRQKEFAASCPKTTEVLESVDGLMSGMPFAFAFFSALQPNSRINAHCAPCNLRLRCHYPLIVPESGCGLRVGAETKSWVEGEPLVFDDAFEHEAFNEHKSSERVVLLFDVWHPDLVAGERESIVEMFGFAKGQGWLKH
jgi:aspartate beta-hydroxylase